MVSIPFLSPTVSSVLLLVGSFLLLLVGAEIFTNGVEWLGRHLGVSESATGSILAAVGTALPETMIPVIAIVGAYLGTGTQAAADEVGVGAILGAPFMLATIATFLVGASVIYFSDRRTYGREFHFTAEATRRDLSFFLVGYTLAFTAALVPSEFSVGGIALGRYVSYGIGVVLVGLYVFYVYRSLSSGDLADEGADLEDLYLGTLVENGVGQLPGIDNSDRDQASDPAGWVVGLQTLLALGLIVGGAQLFVSEVRFVSENVLNVPGAVLALLIAPLATELPEKFNSVIWISRDKDTLAIGNITGAMAFQGTLPVTLGIVFTSWNLELSWGTAGFLNAFSAVLAIVSGVILYLRARRVDEGNMSPRPFLIGGAFYALFLAVVLWHVYVIGLSGVGSH